MSDHETIVQFQEVPRDYRTEIPNIVFVLLEEGYITPSDLALYCLYRKIAGQNGACWMGTRGLAKKCGLSHPTIASSKKVLSQPFELLNGKSLIQITPCDRKKEQADVITIIDIWPENFAFFKKSLTCEKIEHTGVQKDDTRVCKKTTQKNEPYKKEPNKKESNRECGNVHNFSDSKRSANSTVPPPASAAQGSIPLHKEEKNTDFASLELAELLELEPKYTPFFRPNIVARWIKKYGPQFVLETIKYFLQVKATQKKPIPKPEAWMETALLKGFASLNNLCAQNKQYAEKFKKTHQLGNLKINKRYCQDTYWGEDFYYSLPRETFERALNSLLSLSNQVK